MKRNAAKRCNCPDCTNFYQNIELLPQEAETVLESYDKLLCEADEVTVFHREPENEKIFYNAFYLLEGKVFTEYEIRHFTDFDMIIDAPVLRDGVLTAPKADYIVIEIANLELPWNIKKPMKTEKVKGKAKNKSLEAFKTELKWGFEEASFSLVNDLQYKECWLGKEPEGTTPYWVSLTEDGKQLYYFSTVDELFDAKIIYGRSMREKWNMIKW